MKTIFSLFTLREFVAGKLQQSTAKTHAYRLRNDCTAKAVDAKFIESMNNGDADSVMSCYWNSPDLVLCPPGEQELKRWDAAKASFTKFFETSKGAKHAMGETNYKVAGNMVFS